MPGRFDEALASNALSSAKLSYLAVKITSQNLRLPRADFPVFMTFLQGGRL